MRLQNLASITLFIFAYVALLPGLFYTLFSVKATAFGFTLIDMEKSTIGTVQLLMNEGTRLPAYIILFFSVFMPFVKLLALLMYAVGTSCRTSSGKNGARLVLVVQKISKWATIDAFAAAIVVGFLCNQQMLSVTLHGGFYAFLSYCVLSVAGALLIEVPEEAERSSLLFSDLSPKPSRSSLTTNSGAFMMLMVLAVLTTHPILTMEVPMVNVHGELSIMKLVLQLWTFNSKVAAMSLIVFVIFLPALQQVLLLASSCGFTINATVAKWLCDFAMLDVFALAMAVAVLAASGLHNSLRMSMSPLGWSLCGVIAAWVAYSWIVPVRAVAQTSTEKGRRLAV